jgi:hypothetical protein
MSEVNKKIKYRLDKNALPLFMLKSAWLQSRDKLGSGLTTCYSRYISEILNMYFNHAGTKYQADVYITQRVLHCPGIEMLIISGAFKAGVQLLQVECGTNEKRGHRT